MKKIILLLIIFFLTGCYDYNELTDLAIVSSMFIDYKDDEYIVNLEILAANKENSKPSYFIEGKGKTFETALYNVYNKSTMHIYLHHMNTVVISESIAKEKLEELYDYFLRDPDVRKDSYFIMSKDIEKFYNFETQDLMSVGESLKNIIKYNEREKANFKTSKFNEILHSYLNNETYLLGDAEIQKKYIILEDTYAIKDNKLESKIDKTAVLIANILDNSPSTFLLELSNTYEIYKYKSDIKVKDNSIFLKLNVDVRMVNMKNSKTDTRQSLEKLESEISEKLNQTIEDCIQYTKNIDVDIYNFDYEYELFKPNLKRKDIWKDLEYEIDIKTNINEKGLIIDTLGDEINER